MTQPDNPSSKFSFGPATMVAAAFIGPGTVTACTLAGAKFGYALIWALAFSVLACMILQEMAARLGVVSGQGLGESLRQQFVQPLARGLVFGLVAVAIFIGNSAYEGGNIAGAVLGMEALLPNHDWPWAYGIVGIAFLLLWQGKQRVVERALIGLVLLMSLAFITTFILTKPDLGAMLSGLKPTVPQGAWLTVIALVGTTVVPYNLFLHASAVSKRWSSPEQLPQARTDTWLSIGVGGLVSLAIVSTAAAAFFAQQIPVRNGADMAVQLEPLMGAWASVCMGVGLFAAGISSAITAPLAAAYAVAGMLRWDHQSLPFKATWVLVLLSGLVLSVSGYRPLTIITFAQMANGLLLPLLAFFLLWVMNRTDILGQHKNTALHNVLGTVVVVVALILGGKSVWFAIQNL